MIEIDGSYGEGGGQILRTSLSLSCLFKRPFRIFNIRKNRPKPGLMPQHLTSVKAAQMISDAEMTGGQIGSTELTFSPREVKSGSFTFDVGTAGSTALIMQTLLPALIFSQEKATITLRGGTHVPFSPSFHYLDGIFIPWLKRLGMEVRLSIEAYGFYPKGGGVIAAEIFPAGEIEPLRVTERGKVIGVYGYSGVGNLPLTIAERQRRGCVERIESSYPGKFPIDIELQEVPTPGQGTFIFLGAEAERVRAGFTGIGERGKRAEIVGEEVANEFLDYYAADAALDPHLPDQLVLYLSMCRERSEFTTSRITQHLLTNLWAIGRFHKFDYAVEGEIGRSGKVKVN